MVSAMPRNGHMRRQPLRDEFLCPLELRQTQAELAVENLELQRRALEKTLHRTKALLDNSPVGFITFDHACKIIDVNKAAAKLLQVNQPAILGLPMNALISGRTCRRFIEHLRKARHAGGDPVFCEIEMIGGKNGRLLVQIVTSALCVGDERIFETALIDLTPLKVAGEEVARAREYAESIISTIPFPVLVLDEKTRVQGANAAFYHLFQTGEVLTLQWPITELPDIEWKTPGLEASLLRVFTDGRPISDLQVRAESRGSALMLNMSVRRLKNPSASTSLPYLLVAFEDIPRRQRAEDDRELLLAELQASQLRLEARVQERTHELGKSYVQLRTLGEQLVLAHESEQRRIARELHDQIGQDLTALKMTLSRGKNADPKEALQTLREAEALTEELLQTVRNICSTLRPQVLDDLGLLHGLEWHIKTFATRTGMEISIDLQPLDESRLSPIIQSTIFRVIQEALTNVSRHAKTKTAAVTLAAVDDTVQFSVRDNGKGFDAADAARNSSTGLSSMRERVSLVGGKFEISSAPRKGTIITARIPLPRQLATNSEQNRTDYGQNSSNQTHHR